jgi:hypothetical protein
MSTIKVNKIENTSTTDGGVSIDNDGHVTIDGQNFPTAGPLSNRNLIINGAMQVAQRSTSESGVTADAYRSCDRYRVSIDSLGTWTISQSSNAPAGFTKSLRIECTTADASPAANDYIAILYHVEAQDVSWINYGTAEAKPLMLSFYVRSNKTGSGSFAIRQRDNSNKLFSKVYAFDGTQDTWKKIEIPIPADTAGLINTDTGPGLTLEWWLNSGSTFTGGGATTGWEVFDDTKRNPTNAGIGDAVSDYFEITGVQLEVGSKSTPFEHRSYADELHRCMRYYQEYTSSTNGLGIAGAGFVETGTQTEFVFHLSTPMRTLASANITEIGDLEVRVGGSRFDVTGLDSVAFNDNFSLAVTRVSNVNSSASVGTVARLRSNGVGAGFSFNAEL